MVRANVTLPEGQDRHLKTNNPSDRAKNVPSIFLFATWNGQVWASFSWPFHCCMMNRLRSCRRPENCCLKRHASNALSDGFFHDYVRTSCHRQCQHSFVQTSCLSTTGLRRVSFLRIVKRVRLRKIYYRLRHQRSPLSFPWLTDIFTSLFVCCIWHPTGAVMGLQSCFFWATATPALMCVCCNRFERPSWLREGSSCLF